MLSITLTCGRVCGGLSLLLVDVEWPASLKETLIPWMNGPDLDKKAGDT